MKTKLAAVFVALTRNQIRIHGAAIAARGSAGQLRLQSGLWQTISMLSPPGSKTNAPQ
jgi:hypothetical protein